MSRPNNNLFDRPLAYATRSSTSNVLVSPEFRAYFSTRNYCATNSDTKTAAIVIDNRHDLIAAAIDTHDNIGCCAVFTTASTTSSTWAATNCHAGSWWGCVSSSHVCTSFNYNGDYVNFIQCRQFLCSATIPGDGPRRGWNMADLFWDICGLPWFSGTGESQFAGSAATRRRRWLVRHVGNNGSKTRI